MQKIFYCLLFFFLALTAYRKPNNGVVIIGSQGAEKAYNYFKFALDFVELPVLARYDLTNVHSSTSLIMYGGFSPGIAVNKRTAAHLFRVEIC